MNRPVSRAKVLFESCTSVLNCELPTPVAAPAAGMIAPTTLMLVVARASMACPSRYEIPVRFVPTAGSPLTRIMPSRGEALNIGKRQFGDAAANIRDSQQIAGLHGDR